jgi:DNA-binding transcriptional LysR family regulator
MGCRQIYCEFMDLRHLRCFLAVADELHFARAAERLHIEQSPLSRTIRELEEDLGVRLFERNTRSTRLTLAGRVFKERVPQVFAALMQARDGVRAVFAGYVGQLHLALSDNVSQPRLTDLLYRCREEEPDTEIRLHEVPLSQLIKGLEADLYDAGLARSPDVGARLFAAPVWREPMVVAMPARHPLLAHKRLPLQEVMRYPLVLCDPAVHEGYARQVNRVLQTEELEPIVAAQVASHELMITMVAAGYGLGFTTTSHLRTGNYPEIATRPLAGRKQVLTTYLVQRIGERTEALQRFVERALPQPPPADMGDASVTSTGSTT